jgi:FolB domain-containing protein
MDEIRIHDLETRCIVGILPRERVEPQALVVNATLYLDVHDAACSGRIGRTVHYAEVAEQVVTLLRFRRYRLLEAAATELACMLLGIHTRLQRVRLEVIKPAALAGMARAASLLIERDRPSLTRMRVDQNPDMASNAGGEEVCASLWHSPEASLNLLSLQPGRELCPPILTVGSAASSVFNDEPRMTPRTSEPRLLVWVLSGQVKVDGRVLRAGQSLERETGASVEPWLNCGTQLARVFYCATWCDSFTP